MYQYLSSMYVYIVLLILLDRSELRQLEDEERGGMGFVVSRRVVVVQRRGEW